MQQQTRRESPSGTGRFKNSANVAFDMLRVETAHVVEADGAKHNGTVAQPSVNEQSSGVVVGNAERISFPPHRPNAAKAFNPDEHRRVFPSGADSFLSPRRVASRVH